MSICVSARGMYTYTHTQTFQYAGNLRLWWVLKRTKFYYTIYRLIMRIWKNDYFNTIVKAEHMPESSFSNFA